MMKMKKIIALSCAATMLFSSTAFAAGVDDTVEGGGNSVVENDNSTAPHIDRLVLPTVGANTYDFTIDPEGLLANFDPITYATGQSVYFNATKTAAKLEFTNTADADTYGLYVQTKVVDTSLEKLTVLLSGKTQAQIDAPLAGLDQFFVWVPDTANAGEGMYEALTPANLPKVIDITWSADTTPVVSGIALNIEAGSQSNLAGDYIWDGKVYTVGYEPITAEKAAAEYYVPATTDPVAAETIASGLYTAPTDEVTDGTYTNVAGAALGSATANLKYVAAVMQQTGTTDAATIVNKSTFDIGVIAEVTVTNGTGLTFLNSSTIAGEDVTASIYMALTDGTNEAAVDNTTGKATAYYVVKGTGDTAHTYQIEATTGTETGTGSHVYKQYLTSTQTYSDVNFQITAKANTNAGAADAWEDYVETLTTTEDAQTKPSIGVVFKFVEIDDAAVVATEGDAPTYTAAFTGVDASVFTVTPAANTEEAAEASVSAGGWATYTAGEKAPSIAVTSYNYDRTATLVINADFGAGSQKATGVTSIKVGADGQTFGTDLTGACTVDAANGTITFPSGKFATASLNDVKFVQVKFNDGSSAPVVLKLTITK